MFTLRTLAVRTLAVRILAVVLPNSYPLIHSGIVEIDVAIGDTNILWIAEKIIDIPQQQAPSADLHRCPS